MQQLIEDYRTCIADIEKYQKMNAIQQKIDTLHLQIGRNEDWIQIQVGDIVQILLDKGFMIGSAVEGYEFTPKGHFASHIAEIHPLASTDIIFQYDFFEEFTPKQLVALLSCFTDLRVNQDSVKHTPTIDDELLKKCVLDMASKLVVYDETEAEHELNTGFRYQNAVIYDLLDEMMVWVDCSDETSCKLFIQETLIQEKQISIGDFVKAILKISAIAKEWMTICEFEGKISLMHKLQQIDGMILKYVCTTQSLYV
jgi:superfamily II RNA helicase